MDHVKRLKHSKALRKFPNWSLAELLGAKRKRRKKVVEKSGSQVLQESLASEIEKVSAAFAEKVGTKTVWLDIFEKLGVVSGWETTKEKGTYKVTGIAPYYARSPAELFKGTYYDNLKKKFPPISDPAAGTREDPLDIEVKPLVKAGRVSIDYTFQYNGWAKDNKFFINIRLTTKDLGFVSSVTKGEGGEAVVQEIVSGFWNTKTIDPIYDLEYKVEKVKRSGTVKLADGSLFLIPEDDKKFDRRKEFIEKFQEKGVPPKTFPVLLDIKREVLIQTDTTGKIKTFSLKGSMPLTIEDLKKILENTLHDGITSGTGGSMFRTWSARPYLDAKQVAFVEENGPIPMHQLQERGKLLPFLRDLKGIYEERKEGVLRDTYLKVLGPLQALVQNAKRYTSIADKVIEKRRKFNTATSKDTPTIPNMDSDFVFLPLQAEALAKLDKAKETAILDVATGGGKTIILITDILNLMRKGKVTRPLVVMPKGVISQWIGEVNYFTGGKVNPIIVTTETVKNWGEEEIEKLCHNAPLNSIFLTSFSFISTGSRENPFQKKTYIFPKVDWLLDIVKPDYVAIDESHYVKNPARLRNQACMALRGVPYRRISTGTLIPNKPPDLVGQVAFLDPAAVGDKHEFLARYAAEYNDKTGKVYRWKTKEIEGEDAADLIRNDLKNNSFYLIYREKDWAAALPDIEYSYHFTDMTPNQKKIYQVIVTEMMTEIKEDPALWKKWLEFTSGDETPDTLASPRLLGKMAKLEQYLTAPSKFGTVADRAFVEELGPEDGISPKIGKIDELIGKSIAAGNKCIIGVHFKFSARHLAENSMYSESAVYYDAGEEEALIKFRKDDKTKVLFAVQQSITEGLNLQIADRIIIADVDWTPGKFKQFVARIYRPYIDKKTGKNLNVGRTIYVDYVLSNKSADALKFCYQTSKKLFNSQVMEASPIVAPPMPGLFEENLLASMDTFGEQYLKADKAYNGWIEDEVETQRREGKADLIPVKPAPDLKGSKKIDVPWVSGMDTPMDIEGVDVASWARDKGINLKKLAKKSPATKEEKKEIKEKFYDLIVSTQFGEGRIVGVYANRVRVKYPDGTTQSSKQSLVIVLDKTVLEGEEKKRKRIGRKETREEKRSRKGKDKRMKLGLVLYNNIPTLVASLKDLDNEDLVELGFVYQGPYWLRRVKNRKYGEHLLKKLQKKYTIKKGLLRTITGALSKMKGGNVDIKKYEIPETRIFFRRRHKVSKKGQLKIYPAIKGLRLYLFIDKATNKGSFTTYEFTEKPGYWFFFSKRKAEVKKVVRDIEKRLGLEIRNKGSLTRQGKALKISL